MILRLKCLQSMPERDIKELPQYQRNVIHDAKIMLITEEIIKDETDDD